jgi:hypothetical protein
MNAEQSIHFANATLGADRHVCAFFHSPTKNTECFCLSSARESNAGENAFHIVDPRLNRHASAQENAVLVRFLEPRPI